VGVVSDTTRDGGGKVGSGEGYYLSSSLKSCDKVILFLAI